MQTLNYTALREIIAEHKALAHAKNHDTAFEYELETEALRDGSYTVEHHAGESWIKLPWGRMFSCDGSGKKAVQDAVERTINDNAVILEDLKNEDINIDVKFSRLENHMKTIDTIINDADSGTAYCLQKAVYTIMKEATR